MSYAFLGYKWGVPDFGEASGEITWSADLSALPFDDVAHDLVDFETQLQAAFQAWEDVAAIDFTQVAGGANVVVSVGTLAEEPWVAVTEWAASDTPGLEQFSSMTVMFDIEELWAPSFGDGFDLQNFYAVAAHEIGHVIGLEHVTDSSQLMFASTTGPTDLGIGDITGAQILYGTDAGDPLIENLPEPPPESAYDAQSESGDGGGSGGGILVALLGALVAFLAGVFTGGAGPLAALAAAQSRSDDDDEIMQAWEQEALEWIPSVPVAEYAAPVIADDGLDEDLLDWV